LEVKGNPTSQRGRRSSHRVGRSRSSTSRATLSKRRKRR
jgi:hypothetical protein